jgi:hypothetical protein
MVHEINRRRDEGLCTYKQFKALSRHMDARETSFDDANVLIGRLARNGWRGFL